MKKKKKATAIALITFVSLIALTSIADVLRTVGIILCAIAGVALLILTIVAIVKICKTKKRQKLNCNKKPINNFAEDPSYDFEKQQIILSKMQQAYLIELMRLRAQTMQKFKQKALKKPKKEKVNSTTKIKNNRIKELAINKPVQETNHDLEKQQIILANIKKAFEAKNKHQETKVIPINKTEQKPAKETPKESIRPTIKVKNGNINTTNPKENIVNVDNQIYVKKPLMTKCEEYFYKILFEEFSWEYNVQAQINLAAVINKVDNSQYHNELFRNIDLGIFDKYTNDVLVLIEINDKTHEEQKRHVRDLKVRDICKQANIQLITFYTNKPNKRDYVIRKVKEAIGQA